MKKHPIILIGMLLLSVAGCVQKSYQKTVVVTLSAPHLKDIKSVDIRGQGEPLSWDYDLEMPPS